MQRRHLLAGAAGVASSLALPAWSQSGYPNKPIKLIVPYAPGISPDVVSRVIGDKLSQALGQPVVVDNRAGAGGMIGAEAAAAMPADGYNLFYTVKGVMAIAPHLYPQAKYNPLKDFKAVTEVLIVPHIITATPSAPYNTMAELVSYAKANPGKINYASAGVGSQPHVALEAWARRLGIKLTHIPYKTNPSPDVMSGVVSLYLEASTTAIPSIQGKRIKALVVSGAERIPALPDVPTMTEFNPELDPNGVIGNSWHTFFAPAGTPDDIVARLNTEIVKIVKTPEIQARLRSLGLTPTGTPAATVNVGMAQDHAYWGRLIKELDIKVE
ncbi:MULTISPECIES: Bug family tripartite tricarboxylate transporter substrate binding protein [Ramlibacter]|uniref:Tripartite tricarboxylate transporter substrate binding protein n=1 Tax=Ramlibacter pinisoli TaxID=2682844 RepID=A0A6N8IZI7_9BURK|nr:MULTISPECIES: tripartite tricarboxylate transporter substrate-binding protein [Ramlibacter]MBA2961412.1 tripartite tricarboxylate transporter substrate binding protein [Ramlibacter sp. CGMCC 1.13660]MVQ31356.1 tripartite tricarboxylate transporter substrate binding protein [Ramlibacter pinisoli]